MTFSPGTGRAAAAVATVGFGGLAAFQLGLALGAPLGEAAWGGTSADLSSGERIGSAVSVLIYAAAAWVVLVRAGMLGNPKRMTLFTRGTWLLACILGLSALMNFASQSAWENFLLGPVAAVLGVLCGVVAWVPPQDGRVTHRSPPRPPRSAAMR